MVPEHSTHTNWRNTVYLHRSEPNHSEGTKTTICYKVHFWIKFSFQLLLACCQSSPQTAGRPSKKSNSPDTLCELLTRRLLFGRYTYRSSQLYILYTYYKHYLYKMASFAIFICWGFLCQGNKSFFNVSSENSVRDWMEITTLNNNQL